MVGLNNARYEVPKTDSGIKKHVIFAGAIWMGGLDDSKTLRVAANTYRQSGNDFWTGPLENETTDQLNCSNFDRISKVYRTEINDFKAFGNITDNLRYYPAKNNPQLHKEYGQSLPKDQDYAPFVDVNKDGIYNIEDGDYPKIKGDQSLYWIINDLGNIHTETNGNPIGVEVKNTAYAYANTSSILDTTTFYRFDITNRSRFNYTDFIFGLWVDCDLGNFGDDHIGVDTIDNFAFVYNGDDFDDGAEGYGNNIPILGVAMLRAPYTPLNDQSSLGAFFNYETDFGTPRHWGDYYGILQAIFRNGHHLTYGGNGLGVENPPTKYMYSGNPSDSLGNAWSECSVPNTPADRRFLLCSKPFNLPKGATASLEFAVITSFDVQYPCPDITNFKKTVQYVQNFYDALPENEPTSANSTAVLQHAVQVFYDPQHHIAHISSNYKFDSATLFSIQGIQIDQPYFMDDNTLKFENNLTASLYILKLQSADGKTFIQKILFK